MGPAKGTIVNILLPYLQVGRTKAILLVRDAGKGLWGGNQ
jgi:hypothetical protein